MLSIPAFRNNEKLGFDNEPETLKLENINGFGVHKNARICVDISLLRASSSPVNSEFLSEPPTTKSRVVPESGQGSYISMSGCNDMEFSHEYEFELGQKAGAMTFTLMELLKQEPDPTLGITKKYLQENVQKRASASQTPQMQVYVGGYDENKPFFPKSGGTSESVTEPVTTEIKVCIASVIDQNVAVETGEISIGGSSFAVKKGFAKIPKNIINSGKSIIVSAEGYQTHTFDTVPREKNGVITFLLVPKLTGGLLK
ncbi:MAG: hypothetical protein A2161_12015 [Candidatus Schekmanbacteria bacterium RBG_13_48_7]|uniref:Uncharacterized protein n=1 Tax=Candidatus Schekmanbacteria bacterium RBG_13_48_7 TaxID=1817878 RepID=A0A1F7RND0_9BACT|nr:MAG: hypothetical protein A2161_12015 [Candidatus Schekmanbacteria bacterium RBG_13_48_7]